MPSISNFGNVYARPPVKNSPTTSSTQKQPAIRFGMDRPAGDTVSFSTQSGISDEQAKALAKQLRTAIRSKSLENVKTAINALPTDPTLRTAIINQPDERENTPLHLAARSGNPAVVKLLLDYGAQASINQEGDFRETPLHLAARSGNPAVVKLLLDHGALASINKTNRTCKTPLGAFVTGKARLQWEDYDVMGVLLAHNAAPEPISGAAVVGIETHIYEMHNHHTKTLLNPQATPEQLEQAVQWFKLFPPNGGALNWAEQMSKQLELAHQWFQLFPHSSGTLNQEKQISEQFAQLIRDKETELQSPTTAKAQHQAEEPGRKVWLADDEHEK